MNTALSPISVTTFISLVLHAALMAVVLPMQEVMQSTGAGINIELVSSTTVSNKRETEQAARKAVASKLQTRTDEAHQLKKVIAKKKQQSDPVAETLAQSSAPESTSESIDDDAGKNVLARSTNAAMHDISIIELLHTRISERKQYPYMAKRQGREGVARVEFVLHPDGSINDTRLVHSSRTRTLDRAALEAVKGIEPFEPAKDYLYQPEAFQVDVVFNMI
jgi:protein TonB